MLSSSVHRLAALMLCALAPCAALALDAETTEQKRAGMQAESAGRFEAAWKLLLPVAEQGDVDAEYQMAVLTEHGWPGFDGDLEQAMVWYRKAAAQGKVRAQLWLGYHLAGQMAMDASGSRDPEDVLEGVKWLRMAGDKGSREAQLKLADIFTDGLGPVQKNPQEARMWLNRAAAQGDAMAKIMLRSQQQLESPSPAP